MPWRAWVVVFLTCLAAPRGASAQILGLELFAGGGPLLEETGSALDAGVGLHVFPAITVFGQVHHQRTNVRPVSLPERTDKTTALLGGVRLTVFGLLPVSPYVLGAYGRGRVTGPAGAETESATLHLGGGARLRLSRAVSLYGEGRLTLINDTHSDADLSLPLVVGLVVKP
jgi:hypothetical protein